MKITAPFTPVQVQVLNERQVHVDGSMPIHPFSCRNRGDGISYDAAGTADFSGATHATETGWVCPHCGYQQDWAYAAMAERPVPLGEMFKNFPTIAGIYGAVRPEALDQIIANYLALATQSKPGAEVMWFCLERRRMALVGNSTHQVAEVQG